MMKLLIVNGPNLNLLGRREPGVYGARPFDDYLAELRAACPETVVDLFQSNVEGELVDALQRAEGRYDGILLNAGGYDPHVGGAARRRGDRHLGDLRFGQDLHGARDAARHLPDHERRAVRVLSRRRS